MTQTETPTDPADKNPPQSLGVSLRTDRIDWIRATAQINGITVSELVRRAIDAARKNPKALGL